MSCCRALPSRLQTKISVFPSPIDRAKAILFPSGEKDGEILKINYVLHESAEGWQIINIIVDGVSDLALKRGEYQSVFSDTGFTGLVDYLSGQIGDLMPTSLANSE